MVIGRKRYPNNLAWHMACKQMHVVNSMDTLGCTYSENVSVSNYVKIRLQKHRENGMFFLGCSVKT